MVVPPLSGPDGQSLPLSYKWLHASNLLSWTSWHLLGDQQTSEAFRDEFQKETAAPNSSNVKDFQPFAQGGNGDDVAGFVLIKGVVQKSVVEVHLTWARQPEAEGWPGMALYDSLWEWLADSVIRGMEEFDDATIELWMTRH
jgi:hypothetical protein